MTKITKIIEAKKITDFFSFASDNEEGGFYFSKLKIDKKTKTFKSMEEGLVALIEWKKIKLINENEKLDLITLLMRSSLPLICTSEIETREQIMERWNNVSNNFLINLRINKNILKSTKLVHVQANKISDKNFAL
ncbi:MAG: hypothetical protein WC011_00280 [Candidatus Paceibacterota bacterium]